MKKFSRVTLSLLLACCMSTACLGILHGRAKGMAYIEIDGTTQAGVAAAAKKVFLDDAYELVQEKPGELVFEKPGSRMTDLAYGGIMDEDGVWVKAVVTIQEKKGGLCLVSCDAYTVRDRNDAFFRQESRVLRPFGKEHQRMLRQVKRAVKE